MYMSSIAKQNILVKWQIAAYNNTKVEESFNIPPEIERAFL
jgi:hypothetical protein